MEGKNFQESKTIKVGQLFLLGFQGNCLIHPDLKLKNDYYFLNYRNLDAFLCVNTQPIIEASSRVDSIWKLNILEIYNKIIDELSVLDKFCW